MHEWLRSFLHEIGFDFSFFGSVDLRGVDVSLPEGLLKGVVVVVVAYLPAFFQVEVLSQFLIELLFI